MATWPQIVILVMLAIMLLMGAANDGKPREDYKFGFILINVCLEFFLLWMGGFWHALGWQ